MARHAARELVITGIGMVTAVGPDAVTTCASVRAGLSRAQELPGFPLLNLETYEESVLRGHPITDYTEGFCLVGAWLRLALGSVLDLLAHASVAEPKEASFWAKTGLLVVTPELNAERFGAGAEDLAALEGTYLARLKSSTQLSTHRDVSGFVGSGHAGALHAVERARTAIAAGTVDRVLVVAADSYLDDLSLSWLAVTERLKTPDNAVGLAPGEAGACVLVEARDAALRRDARILARLDVVQVDREASAFARGELSQALALGRVLRQVLGATPRTERYSGDWFADLNGEVWRAHEFGSAQARIADLLGDVRTVFPAASLGDTGAASGALTLGLAARAIERQYASGEKVLLTASSIDGQVGAAMLSTDQQSSRN